MKVTNNLPEPYTNLTLDEVRELTKDPNHEIHNFIPKMKLTEEQKKLVSNTKYCVSEYNGVLTKIYFDGRTEVIEP